jgi:hypothetical protein
MSDLTMGNVEIRRSTHDEAGLVEYRIRWTAEIDAIAAKAAARRGVETHTLIAHAIYAAIAAQNATAAEGETKH